MGTTSTEFRGCTFLYDLNKHLKISFFFLQLGLGLGFELWAQDRIYLSTTDSILVKIPGDPRKETDLRKKAIGDLDDYGFLRIVAVYNKDSIRVHTPERIKGYRRDSVGKYIGSGYFESRVLDTKIIGYGRRSTERPVFLQRVIKAHQYTLWFYRESTGNANPDNYYLLEEKDKVGYLVFTTKKDWLTWAEKTDPFSEIIKEIPPPKRRNRFSTQGFSHLQNVFREYRDKYNLDGTKMIKQ